MSAAAAAAAAAAEGEGDESPTFTLDRFAQFKAIVDARFSCKRFRPGDTPIPQEIIDDLVDVTRRAPTSFNTQPYRIILVRDKAQREALAQCMSPKNAIAVTAAPLTAVFCADTEVVRENSRLTKLLLQIPGIPAGYVRAIPSYVVVGLVFCCVHSVRQAVNTTYPPANRICGACVYVDGA